MKINFKLNQLCVMQSPLNLARFSSQENWFSAQFIGNFHCLTVSYRCKLSCCVESSFQKCHNIFPRRFFLLWNTSREFQSQRRQSTGIRRVCPLPCTFSHPQPFFSILFELSLFGFFFSPLGIFLA